MEECHGALFNALSAHVSCVELGGEFSTKGEECHGPLRRESWFGVAELVAAWTWGARRGVSEPSSGHSRRIGVVLPGGSWSRGLEVLVSYPEC